MIRVENVMKVIDINDSDVHLDTVSYFENKVGRTYTDTNTLGEDLYAISDPEELDTENEPAIVQEQVKELVELAKSNDAAYVRFLTL